MTYTKQIIKGQLCGLLQTINGEEFRLDFLTTFSICTDSQEGFEASEEIRNEMVDGEISGQRSDLLPSSP